MVQETENSVKSIMSSLNEQDNKQKIGIYFAFIMEFYRVLMGSFLILFVPQKCDNEICGLFENVITGNPVIATAFSVNIAAFSLFMAMYYAELIRENKMINYLHVNPELPRDNETVGDALVNLPERKKESILLWDKRYQSAGRIAMVGFIVNLGLSGYVIFLNYLDNKTVTVFLTNALFMGLKLNDVKDVTETDINIFLSAYLTRKIQYNDVDPDKKLSVTDNSV